MNSPLPTAVGVSVEFLRNKAPFLARDYAMQLAPGPQLAESWGLTPAQWDALVQSPVFLDMVRQANEELATPDGLAEKIRRKAGMVVEQVGVLAAARILTSSTSAPGVVLNALSELKELAGLSKQATNAGLGATSGPLIQINVNREGKNESMTVGVIDIPPPPPGV